MEIEYFNLLLKDEIHCATNTRNILFLQSVQCILFWSVQGAYIRLSQGPNLLDNEGIILVTFLAAYWYSTRFFLTLCLTLKKCFIVFFLWPVGEGLMSNHQIFLLLAVPNVVPRDNCLPYCLSSYLPHFCCELGVGYSLGSELPAI